jgi:WD40 repeat protein
VISVAFSPDGQILASSGGQDDKTIILWDVTTHQPLGPPLTGHTDEVADVAFSPDGQTLASASEDKTVILWDMSLASWQARACRIANRNLSQDEWQQFFGDEPYHKTCPELPGPGE